jgi:hypothetical protein
MFNEIIAGRDALPVHLSSDHDPLFEFRQWQTNLRILDVTELKAVPYVPFSASRGWLLVIAGLTSPWATVAKSKPQMPWEKPVLIRRGSKRALQNACA